MRDTFQEFACNLCRLRTNVFAFQFSGLNFTRDFASSGMLPVFETERVSVRKPVGKQLAGCFRDVYRQDAAVNGAELGTRIGTSAWF